MLCYKEVALVNLISPVTNLSGPDMNISTHTHTVQANKHTSVYNISIEGNTHTHTGKEVL